MPIPLIDKETGKALLADDPRAALESGRFQGDPSQRYSAIGPNGQAVSFDGSALAEALAKGYQIETPEERAKRKEKDQYSGTASELKAGAAGAARGLTFGASDWALTRSGAVDPRTLERLKEYQPEASAAGEIGGVAGGLLLPTGWIGAGVKGAAGLGGLAGRLAAKGLAAAGMEGGGLAARALAKGLSSGVGAATEGALYGAGQGISEAALGDPEDAASKIIAHTGMGALFGGVLGAGAGALGAVGKRALEESAALASRVGRDATEAATGGLANTLDAAGNATVRQRGRPLAKALEDLSNEQALDAAGLMKRDYKALQRQVRQLESVGDTEGAAEAKELVSLHEEAGRVMRERGLAKAGDNLADVNQRVVREVERAQDKAATYVRMADGAGAKVNVKGFADDLRAMADDLKGRPEMRSTRDELLKRADDYAEIGGETGDVGFSRAEELKRDFDDAFEGSGAPVKKRIARQARGIWNKRIEAAAKDTLGAEDFAAWKDAKRTQEALFPVLKASKDRMAALQSNRKFSLTDTMTGLSTMGGSIAAFGANPVAAAAGLAAAGLHKVVRERGSAAVSDWANRAAMRLADNQAARSAQLIHMQGAADNVTRNVSKAVKALGEAIDRTPALGAPTAVKGLHETFFLPQERRKAADREDAYDKRVTEIANLANNPALLHERLDATLGDVTRFAPRVGAEMALAATRAIQHLAKVAPTNPYVSAPADIRKAWRPTTMEMARFERAVKAVNDPLGTVKEFASGRVSKEAANALREIYPGIYAQVVKEIVPKLTAAQHIPLQRRLEMADVLGVSLDSITSPQLTASLQQMYAKPPQQGGQANRTTGKNFRAQQATTPMQRALGGL
jgi:hypothetical protein